MSKVMVGIWSVSRRLFSSLRAAVVLIGLAAAPAAADHPADVSEPGTWAHRLTVRVVAGVLEGYDFGHQPEVPPAPAQASRTRVVDLPAVFRTPQLGRFDDVGGLRPLWGGGPFVPPGTGGFRPRDGDIVMCFERSEARYALFGDHRILLWTKWLCSIRTARATANRMTPPRRLFRRHRTAARCAARGPGWSTTVFSRTTAGSSSCA